MLKTRRRHSPSRFLTLLGVLALALVGSSLATALAQMATPVGTPAAAQKLPPAWLEFGPGGELLARVLVLGSCPAITLDGVDRGMRQRAPASDPFPVVACEASIPFGVREARIASQPLPLPSGPLARIAVIGDTGCRLSDWDKRYQACNDPHAWPFAQVAASVAAWKPDLVVHVGDYLYREAACPPSGPDCAGSPHGDNWQTWNADFFAAATPLLGAAPWVFMRGNHETCARNPEGWFAYLDPRPFLPVCQRFTEPYLLPLNGVTFSVIDSAEAADTTDSPEETAEYARQFDLLAQTTPPGAWLVTHRPVRGILAGKDGEFEVENATYESATGGSLKAHYALVLSGHIHLAESIAFDPASARPLQIVAGNSGTALDHIPTASPTAGQLDDPTVAEAETLSSFGFLTLEPENGAWTAMQRDASGAPLRTCSLDPPEILCDVSR